MQIEELAEENRVLTQKLENALDRYEAVRISNFTCGAIAIRSAWTFLFFTFLLGKGNKEALCL